ncbi:LysR family transcriptional regulator [Auraticoccus monumenti]|uniref:ModE molybdate transport repressor domain-containing protein n=1 Tax=Auraticoccus monumenti TaxID=675864 RepID=A0A1G6WHA1_9ACTN|nr:LysR family transcriptional regulator [Auraticoccus monumenti]SDD65164.1 ModE molybdate transport repressor domain-containing protein [Auraticoccus monumenti]
MVSPRVPDLDSLQLLLEIAVTGSLGRAATAHGLSQPAVSARLRTMEALVGVPLVERSPRGSSLTAAGVLVAGWAREVLTAAEMLDAGITSLRADQDQHLRVAASMTVAEHLLPRWLVRLAADRPRTAVSLQAMNSTQVEQAVLADQVDLGFVEGPDVGPGLDDRVVAHDRLVVVVAPTHPWARRRRVDAAELAATRLVQREPTSGTRTALAAALAEHGPLATPLLELSTSTAVRSATAAGAGPAVLSHLAVQDDLDHGRLLEVPIRGADLTRLLRAVWPSDRRTSRPAQELLDIATIAERGDR